MLLHTSTVDLRRTLHCVQCIIIIQIARDSFPCLYSVPQYPLTCSPAQDHVDVVISACRLHKITRTVPSYTQRSRCSLAGPLLILPVAFCQSQPGPVGGGQCAVRSDCRGAAAPRAYTVSPLAACSLSTAWLVWLPPRCGRHRLSSVRLSRPCPTGWVSPLLGNTSPPLFPFVPLILATNPHPSSPLPRCTLVSGGQTS